MMKFNQIVLHNFNNFFNRDIDDKIHLYQVIGGLHRYGFQTYSYENDHRNDP